jgi:hypothetical protein
LVVFLVVPAKLELEDTLDAVAAALVVAALVVVVLCFVVVTELADELDPEDEVETLDDEPDEAVVVEELELQRLNRQESLSKSDPDEELELEAGDEVEERE